MKYFMKSEDNRSDFFNRTARKECCL